MTLHIFNPPTQILTFHSTLFSKFGFESIDCMGGSPSELSGELVTQEKRKKGWRMNCDVGEATERLENEL